jgi:hypothetical protein
MRDRFEITGNERGSKRKMGKMVKRRGLIGPAMTPVPRRKCERGAHIGPSRG